MSQHRIGFAFRAVNNLIRRYFEFASNKRTVDQATGNNGWIIGYLADNLDRDIYQKDIEKHFTIARSTASKVLSLMAQKGLIQRLPVAADARLKKIILTDKALQIRDIMAQDETNMEEIMLQGFSAAEVEQLLDYLSRMKDNLSSALETKSQ
ncbi:MAG: MarR family winged helix-turn-helix transcriptional regulator [Oscillospiraceae bacterium]|nr:MarR family winged helix-turn-helix transcriptional regulator [Oscillospiraceae bacterium]MDD4368167.1 MarR family winged helix-turn-helix transcriptional regulator [Oscillospiraceae bacterium]